MSRTTKTRRRRPGAAGTVLKASRQRVNQEKVDQMAAYRRQGLTNEEIGIRLGCSERTVRRYTGQVEPQIHLPPAIPEPEPASPGRLREDLARWFSDLLYKNEEHPRPRESVRFMAEAMRLVRERLAESDPLVLELLVKDSRMRLSLLNEAVGETYHDFKRFIKWQATWEHLDTASSAVKWVPRRERPVIPDDAEPDDY